MNLKINEKFPRALKMLLEDEAQLIYKVKNSHAHTEDDHCRGNLCRVTTRWLEDLDKFRVYWFMEPPKPKPVKL